MQQTIMKSIRAFRGVYRKSCSHSKRLRDFYRRPASGFFQAPGTSVSRGIRRNALVKAI
jgi:hypothetical protein